MIGISVITALCIFTALCALIAFRRYREHVRACTTALVMPTSIKTLQRLARPVARLMAWVRIGKLHVVGGQNLDAPGHLIFAPNHAAFGLDIFVMHGLLKEPARFMTASDVMGDGNLGTIMAGAGSYAVDRTTPQKAVRAIEPSVQELVKGTPLCIFINGTVEEDTAYLPTSARRKMPKRGPAEIAIRAWKRLPEAKRVGIVPVHICYLRRDNATMHGPITSMGLKWRGGAIVTIGKPVYVDELPPRQRNRKELTRLLRDTIFGARCRTHAMQQP